MSTTEPDIKKLIEQVEAAEKAWKHQGYDPDISFNLSKALDNINFPALLAALRRLEAAEDVLKHLMAEIMARNVYTSDDLCEDELILKYIELNTPTPNQPEGGSDE